MIDNCKHISESDRCELCGLLLDNIEMPRAQRRRQIEKAITEAHAKNAYELDEYFRDQLDIWTVDEN